ncbi:MAG: nucleotidyltransferase domain-containing protein [Chloroflexi bacterium]|nr:nucleotidyltransferase domain-containing protein [Chloroflexota bacterium]
MNTKPSTYERGKLIAVFARYPEIQAVYLFGSGASGRTHAESDLDLAILSSPSLAARKLDILTDLARQGICNVDLIFLERADIVLRYEAVRLNQLVYTTPNFDRGELYSNVVRQYLDFLPYLEVQRQAYKRKVLSGTKRSPAETSSIS